MPQIAFLIKEFLNFIILREIIKKSQFFNRDFLFEKVPTNFKLQFSYMNVLVFWLIAHR